MVNQLQVVAWINQGPQDVDCLLAAEAPAQRTLLLEVRNHVLSANRALGLDCLPNSSRLGVGAGCTADRLMDPSDSTVDASELCHVQSQELVGVRLSLRPQGIRSLRHGHRLVVTNQRDVVVPLKQYWFASHANEDRCASSAPRLGGLLPGSSRLALLVAKGAASLLQRPP